MNPWLGWLIAFGVMAAGWFGYGVRGVAMAATVIAFVVLLQFNRVVRVMRSAAASPIGFVPSAVMLQTKLQVGQPMVKVVGQTKSLGRRADGPDEVYTWTDAGGDSVTVSFVNGRCTHWVLRRADETPATEANVA